MYMYMYMNVYMYMYMDIWMHEVYMCLCTFRDLESGLSKTSVGT